MNPFKHAIGDQVLVGSSAMPATVIDRRDATAKSENAYRVRIVSSVSQYEDWYAESALAPALSESAPAPTETAAPAQ